MPSFRNLTTCAPMKLSRGSVPPTSIPLPRGLSRPRGPQLSFPRSHRFGYLLWENLHFPKENKSQHFSGGSSCRHYGLRSRLYRSGGNDPAALAQPFWPKCVNYVSGTFCKGCLRTVQGKSGGGRGIRTPGTVSRTAVFKTAAFNHSAIPPQ